jgi:urease accessory protein UreF
MSTSVVKKRGLYFKAARAAQISHPGTMDMGEKLLSLYGNVRWQLNLFALIIQRKAALHYLIWWVFQKTHQ